MEEMVGKGKGVLDCKWWLDGVSYPCYPCLALLSVVKCQPVKLQEKGSIIPFYVKGKFELVYTAFYILQSNP